MSLLVSFNGQNYIIPETNEVGWGSNLDAYFVAIAAGCLQKIGGSFTISAETDFGSSFGLKSLYYKSRSADVSNTGVLRGASAESLVSFRNNAGNGDLPLSTNASDQLTFNGVPVAGSGLFTANRAVITNGTGDLSVATTTSTEIGYVNGVTSSIQTQLDSKPTATIASGSSNQLTYYTGSVALAAVTAITAARALVSDSNGLPIASVTTAAELAFVSGVTSAIQTQLNTKATDSLVVHLAGTETITGQKTFSLDILTASSKGIIFKDNSTNTVTLKATNSTTPYTLSLPTTSGSLNQYLTTDGSGNTSWTNAAGSGTVNTGTAGRITLYPSSTNIVGDTYVQNSQNITLAIATQASRSTPLALTIPNPGNAVSTANVLLSEGAQTIVGAQTLSSVLTLNNGLVVSTGDITIQNTGILKVNSTSSQIILGVGGLTTIITSPAPAATRTYTIPDAGTDAKFILSQSAQTIVGQITLSAALLAADGSSSLPGISFSADSDTGFFRSASGNVQFISNATAQITFGGGISLLGTATQIQTDGTAGLKIQGVTNGSNVAGGNVGEAVRSNVADSSAVSSTGSGQYFDVTSIALTAGDWDITGQVGFQANGATVTESRVAISSTSGNSATGLVFGDNVLSVGANPNASTDSSGDISNFRVNITSTTTYYLKAFMSSSVATPKAYGRISARRIR